MFTNNRILPAKPAIALILFSVFMIAVHHAGAAVLLTVNPSAITNDYVGKITLTITGLTPGQAVVMERYGDFNGNGVIDAGEPVLQGGVIMDGTLPTIGGVRNLNVPGDEDGATNGQVRLRLIYPGAEKGVGVIAGKYLIKVSDPASGFAPITNSFEVKQRVFPQGVSGRITALGTGIPLANAPVVLLPPDSDPVTGTTTDANGNYTLHSPAGNYMVLPLAPGFVGNFNGGVTVSPSAFATLNLALPAATRTISGKLKGSANGLGLPGVFIQAESDNGQFVSAFSRSDGTYSVGVVADNWKLEPSSGSLAQLGYLGWNNGTNVNVTSGNVANLDLPVNPATALIYGTVKNNQTNPVIGVGIWAEDQPNRRYDTSGTTFPPNADYCVGVRPGNWGIGPDSGLLAALGYTGQGTNVTVTANQALRVDFVLEQLNAHLLGRVVDNLGAAVANLGFNASNHRGVENDVSTDGNGNFNVGVSGGTWYLQLSSEDAQQNQLISPQLEITLADGETRSNLVVIAQRATAQISGAVRNSSANPITGLWVWGQTTVNGTNYIDGMQTDPSGHYFLNAFNGTWEVSLDSNDLQSRGYFAPGSVQTNVAGANVTVDFVANQPAAHLRGRLVDNAGADVGSIQFGAYNESQSSWRWTQTAEDGSFDLGVEAGSWSLNLSSGDAQARGLIGPNLSVFNVVNGVDQNNIVVVAQRVTAQIVGYVRDTSANPIADLGVWSSVTVNGTNYDGYTWTDASGHYQLGACNGTWQVGLDCGGDQGLESRGYNCVDPAQTTVAGANMTLDFVVPSGDSLQITTPSLPEGSVGESYNQQLQATGGQPPYDWGLVSGTLPPGLGLSSSGDISGSPSAVGTNAFSVRVTDFVNGTVVQDLAIIIRSALGTGQWSDRAFMSIPRAKAGTAVLNGKVYVVAGWLDAVTPTATMEVYDAAIGSWQDGAPMPLGCSYTPVMGAINGLLYAPNTFNLGAYPWTANRVLVYNPQSNAWTNLAGSPVSRDYGPCGGVIDNKLYVAGGTSDRFNSLEVYDPAANSWMVLAPMLTPRNGAISVVVSNQLYVFGGDNAVAGGDSLAVEVYDPQTDNWSSLPSMPASSAGRAAALCNGKIYFMGGGDSGGSTEMVIFDPANHSWSSGRPLPTKRRNLAVVAVGNSVLAIGGSIWPGSMPMSLPTVEQFSPPGADRISVIAFKSDAATLAAGLGVNLTQSMYNRLDAGGATNLTFTPALMTNAGAGINLAAVGGATPDTQVITILPGNGQNGFFKTSFVLPDAFIGAQLSLAANADYYARAFLNGYPITSSMMSNVTQRIEGTKHTFCAARNPAWLKPGTNELVLAVANYDGGGSGVMFYGFVTYQMVPRIRPAVWTGPGQIEFQVGSVTNETYTVQASTDLKTWTNILTTNISSGAFDFKDTNAAGPSRSYRVKVGP